MMNTGESSTSPVKFFRRLLSPTTTSSPLPAPRTSDIHQLFNYFDENGDGKITATELQNRLKTVAGDEVQLSDEEAEMAVRSSDADGDGVLGFDDFTKMMKEGAEEELREAFRMYSAKSEGVITEKSLRRMLRRLGQTTVTAEECKGMIGRFDVNEDGVLDYNEFRAMMT